MKKSVIRLAIVFGSFGCCLGFTGDARAQLLLRDDFDETGIVDPTVWRLPFEGAGTFVGRTQFRGDSATDMPLQGVVEPAASDGFVTEIHLDTFSPIDPGNQFLGTDLLTKRNFARAGGLRFEGRLRLKPTATTDGLVNGFFTFDVTRESSPGIEVRDEIDFELLSNQTTGTATQNPLTNVYSEAPFAGPGSAGDPEFVDVAGLNLTEFQDYKVEWTPQSVKWFVNDSLVRTETENVPDDPQKLHFNLWAPDSGFASAFDSALQPAATAGANQRYTAQLDHVEVSRFNTTISDNLLADPSLEGSLPLDIMPSETRTETWLKFNNAFFVFADDPPSDPNLPDEAADGLVFGQTFGPFLGNTNASGFVQQVDAEPGQEFEAKAKILTPSADTIAGTQNYTTVAISFVDANGDVLETAPFVPRDGKDFPLLDGRDPNIVEDEYVQGVVNAKAPAGTAFARVTLLFLQQINDESAPEGDPGAAYFDDISLTLLTPDALPQLPGDFNGDLVVDAADYTVWRNNLGQDESALMGNGDGMNGVDQGDYLLWRNNYGEGGVPAGSGSAIPEPTSATLALLGVLLLRRRR